MTSRLLTNTLRMHKRCLCRSDGAFEDPCQRIHGSIARDLQKGNEVDGKLYAIPVYGNTWAQQVLTFNDQFVKKYNLDISKVDGSYESATNVLRQFHEKNQISQRLRLVKTLKHLATSTIH